MQFSGKTNEFWVGIWVGLRVNIRKGLRGGGDSVVGKVLGLFEHRHFAQLVRIGEFPLREVLHVLAMGNPGEVLRLLPKLLGSILQHAQNGNQAHDLHFRRSRVNENPVHMALGHVATELELLCAGEDLLNVFGMDGKKDGGHFLFLNIFLNSFSLSPIYSINLYKTLVLFL